MGPEPAVGRVFFRGRGRADPAPEAPPPGAGADVDADDELDSLGASADPDGVRRGDGGGRGMDGTRFCVVDIVACREWIVRLKHDAL